MINRCSLFQYRSAVSGCCSAHSVLITMNRKALAFGKHYKQNTYTISYNVTGEYRRISDKSRFTDYWLKID